MKKKLVIIFSIFLLSFMILPDVLQAINSGNHNHYLQIPEKSPQSATAADPEALNLNYTINYKYDIDGQKSQDSLKLSLNIQGNNLHLENGTIQYFIDKNITDTLILDRLNILFSQEHVQYFSNHQEDEPFTTYFSYRREAVENSTQDFEENAIYTIFWLNTTQFTSKNFQNYSMHRFFRVSQPYNLFINNRTPHVEETKWSDNENDLRRNVRILEPYYLRMNLNDDLIIKLFYEKSHTVLLRAYVYNQNKQDGNEFEIEIFLQDKNFEVQYLEENPYYEEYKKILLTITLSSLAGICLIAVYIKINKKKREILNIEKKDIDKDNIKKNIGKSKSKSDKDDILDKL